MRVRLLLPAFRFPVYPTSRRQVVAVAVAEHLLLVLQASRHLLSLLLLAVVMQAHRRHLLLPPLKRHRPQARRRPATASPPLPAAPIPLLSCALACRRSSVPKQQQPWRRQSSVVSTRTRTSCPVVLQAPPAPPPIHRRDLYRHLRNPNLVRPHHLLREPVRVRQARPPLLVAVLLIQLRLLPLLARLARCALAQVKPTSNQADLQR